MNLWFFENLGNLKMWVNDGLMGGLIDGWVSDGVSDGVRYICIYNRRVKIIKDLFLHITPQTHIYTIYG